MTFQPADRIREAAISMQPVVDPAGWYPEDLAANDHWIYELSEIEAEEGLVREAAVIGPILFSELAGLLRENVTEEVSA